MRSAKVFTAAVVCTAIVSVVSGQQVSPTSQERLVQKEGFGRSWTPMVELITDRDLETGVKTNLDVIPQFQVSLSRRQHIMANLGVRFPANNTLGRTKELMFYVLWDWVDGGLKEGW